MSKKIKIPSDIEKLRLLNKLGKIYSPNKLNRTNNPYHSYSYTKNNAQTVYLQRTNPNSFYPRKIKLLKKKNNINSTSPNSFERAKIDTNNNSFEYFLNNNVNNNNYRKINLDINLQNKNIQKYKNSKDENIGKIYELKNSLGNPKYARNIMINRDARNNRIISVSTTPDFSRREYKVHSFINPRNKNKNKYELFSNKKKRRSQSYNLVMHNTGDNSLDNESSKDDLYNQYKANINNLKTIGQRIDTNPSNIYANNSSLIQEEIQTTMSNNDISDNIKINLNDLTYIEGRLNDIILSLNNDKNIFDINAKYECFQFLKFYKKSTFFNKFPSFFTFNNQLIIKSAFNLHLFIVIITYNLSANPSMLNKVILLLRKIYNILKLNLFLFIRQIELVWKDTSYSYNDLRFQTCHYYLNQKGINYLNENDKINLVNNNCISIVNDIKIILNLYLTMNSKYYQDLKDIYLNISKISEQDIYNYFYNCLAIDDSIDSNNNNNNNISMQKEIIEDEIFMDNIIFSYRLNKVIPPFLRLPCKKKFTIVLDLEDTLLNIRYLNNGKLLLSLRPGLFSFLSGIKQYYEIISFSKFSKNYSSTIINYIQGNSKLFDYSFYREHCALIGRKFYKDITRIGRDMKRIIMVDDLPENLDRHWDNGILIKPYEGSEQNNDRVLYELRKMLILFYRLGYDDIRFAIKKFKSEIYEKITLGICE